ncbi:ABC transporter permease [Mucilaginibacter aquariorum]|uniref:FtsX-like permease family protein n=1 Tax=Mucilaginibacter aquariorum TaxID=2967225 RepID=A0ABT1SW92_9SPHI|nr:ABC transporter permease [Mucilaginibacter aquariorum]MCQ6956599.1 FtsX-like permease family protein [Mucilaginibacter aquariorum]
MFKTNLKIAWRSLWKHKAYSLINIIGLSTGLIACLIVATVVIDELSYDHQWTKGKDIYRVLSINNNVKGNDKMPVVFSGFGPSVKKDMPEVAEYCRVSVGKDRLQLGSYKEGIALKAMRAEPSVWNMFDFNILQGNPKQFVKGYTNLIISKKIQQQYFPNQDVVGKIISNLPEYGKPKQYLITGVIDDIPQNTHLRADVITLKEYKTSDNVMPESGYFTFEPSYILLKPGTPVNAFSQKVNKWYRAYMGKKDDYSFELQSIKDVYLRSDFSGVQTVHGSIQNVYIFSAVAALLLIIACINFVNLTISRVFNRAKETGVRKVLGAGKGQLLVRFLSESVLFFVISFLLAIFLYPFLLKPVETYLGHQLVSNLYSSAFLFITVCGVLLVSVCTGLYPAWFLSRPKPIVILRDKVSADIQLNFLKKALVVGQFVISVAIIGITVIVHNQISFMSNKDLGFDKNNLLNISYTEWGKSGKAFKQQVKQISGVQNASITDWYPSSGAGNMSRTVLVQKDKMDVYFIQGDADLPLVLKLQLKTGRLLNPQLGADAMDSDSLMSGSSKETLALKAMQPLLITNYTAGLLEMKLNSTTSKFEGIPVGIVKDFYSESLHNKIKPTIIQAVSNPQWGAMLVRVIPGTEKQVLTNLDKLYKQYYPDKPFQYNWVSDQVNEQYKAEFKLQQLFTFFSLLIVFLACMGLFGLVSFTAEQRVKEIGIRKVLGAGLGDIVGLISKDYLRLVIISIVIATPIAWYAMSKWLQDFAYRIDIQWWVFALAGGLAVLIAFFTISLQSVKAAIANPVKSLRSE